jgi:hypothetical protein
LLVELKVAASISSKQHQHEEGFNMVIHGLFTHESPEKFAPTVHVITRKSQLQSHIEPTSHE